MSHINVTIKVEVNNTKYEANYSGLHDVHIEKVNEQVRKWVEQVGKKEATFINDHKFYQPINLK